MTSFTKQFLSASTNGKLIKVGASATPGTLIHTAHASAMDEIWLWAVNSDTTDRKLTIEFGGTTAPNDLIEMTISAESGLIAVAPGIILTNSLVVNAFAATVDVVMIGGFVNRIA